MREEPSHGVAPLAFGNLNYSLFYFAGVAPKGYTMMHIYRGIGPFIILQVIGLALLVAFPPLITWLPALFFGS